MQGKEYDELVKRLLSGGFAALFIKVANAGLTYSMIVILAWLMPVAEYGRFAFGLSLAMAVSALPSFGLHVSVLRYWPEYNSTNQEILARSFIVRAFVVILAGSTLCAILFFLGAMYFSGGTPGYGAQYFGVIAALITLMSVSQFIASTLRADGAITLALAPQDVLWRLLTIVACIIAATRPEPLDAQLALLLSSVCLFGLCLPQLLYTVRRLRVGIADFSSRAEYREWTDTAWPIWGGTIIFAMVQQFDVVLLGMFLSPEETGPYFAAIRTASLIGLFLMAGNMVVAPMISRYYHSGDHDRLRRMCTILIVGITVPTFAIFALLAILGPWLLSLFDHSFTVAYPLLLILGLGFLFTAVAGPAPYFLQMVGRQKGYLQIMATVYAGVIVTQCLLLPHLGAMGAAIPNAVGAFVAAVWSVVYLRRHVGFDSSVAGLAWPAAPPNEAKATT